MFSFATYRPEIKFLIKEEEEEKPACKIERLWWESKMLVLALREQHLRCVSMKSNRSMNDIPPDLSDGAAVTSDPLWVSCSSGAQTLLVPYMKYYIGAPPLKTETLEFF